MNARDPGRRRGRRSAWPAATAFRRPGVVVTVWGLAAVLGTAGAGMAGGATPTGATPSGPGSSGAPAASPAVDSGTTATFNKPPADWHGNQCQGSPTPPPVASGAPAVPLQQFPQGTQTQIAAANGDAVLETAYSIFDGLTCTHYQHSYEVNAQYVYADCVGWTANLTRLSNDTAWSSLVSRTNLRRGYAPSPGRFRQFMASLVTRPSAGWSAVRSVGGLRAGDILAWTPEVNQSDTSGTGLAGHSVLAISDPVKVAGTTNSYYLVVMDSTATPHGPQDSRSQLPDGSPVYPWGDRNAPLAWVAKPGKANASALSGLGIGTIELVAGPTLARTQIYWSPPRAQGTSKPETVTLGAARPIG